jgi:hypothetical protein
MGRPKGQPKTGGRKKGTPNKASQPWKALVTAICESPDHQAALEGACLERPDLIFKAAEHAFGKPTQHVSLDGKVGWYIMPDGEDVAES